MPTHLMFQFIHRGVWQIPGRKGQGNISRPPPLYIYTAPPQDTHWIPISSISYIRKSKASPGPSRRQCSYVYRTPPQSQHWQIPTATHLGPASTIITSIPTKTNIRTNQPTQQLPPYWYPPTPCPATPPLLPIYVGDTIIFLQLFLLVSICVHLPTPPLFIYM